MAENESGAEAQLLATLIGAVARRDQSALERVYRIAAPRVFACVLRIVRRRDIAQELSQEVFLTLWQRAHEYDLSRGTPLAWLMTIARHKAIDHVRRVAEVDLDDEAPEVAADSIDPVASIGKAQDEARLVAGLCHLEPERLQMILLAFMFGWSRDQIAAHFHCPTGTVKTWLHRTIAELRTESKPQAAAPLRPAASRSRRAAKVAALV